MSRNVYECMYILDANAYARNPGGAADNIQQMVEKSGGEMLASRLWNEQKLAYPIKGRHKGAYWLSYVRLDGTKIGGLNRSCQLNDIILRHLVVKIDDRLVDALVAAAKGEAVVPEEESKATPKKPEVVGRESKDENKEAAAVVDG